MKTGNKLTPTQVELLHWMRNGRSAYAIRMWDVNNRIDDIAKDYEKTAVQNYALRKQNAILRNKIAGLKKVIESQKGGKKDE
jgi:hypothetical protein